MSGTKAMRMTGLPALAVALALLGACGPGPAVVQGTVTSYDPATKVVVIQAEGAQPTTMELSIAEAEVGADPVAGDTVRLAYRDVGGKHVASRVMNISRQDELGKKGSGGH